MSPTTTENIATVEVTGDEIPIRVPKLPPGLFPKSDLAHAKVDAKQTFHFEYLPGGNFAPAINGVQFSPTNLPLVSPILGEVQQWTLINDTLDDHPFHIHVNDFEVMSRNGVPQKANGLKDVVIIPKQRMVAGKLVPGTIVMRTRFTDFDGWFVFHCHILDHEDFGMMATIQVRKSAVVPITPPPDAEGHTAAHGSP